MTPVQWSFIILSPELLVFHVTGKPTYDSVFSIFSNQIEEAKML